MSNQTEKQTTKEPNVTSMDVDPTETNESVDLSVKDTDDEDIKQIKLKAVHLQKLNEKLKSTIEDYQRINGPSLEQMESYKKQKDSILGEIKGTRSDMINFAAAKSSELQNPNATLSSDRLEVLTEIATKANKSVTKSNTETEKTVSAWTVAEKKFQEDLAKKRLLKELENLSSNCNYTITPPPSIDQASRINNYPQANLEKNMDRNNQQNNKVNGKEDYEVHELWTVAHKVPVEKISQGTPGSGGYISIPDQPSRSAINNYQYQSVDLLTQRDQRNFNPVLKKVYTVASKKGDATIMITQDQSAYMSRWNPKLPEIKMNENGTYTGINPLSQDFFNSNQSNWY